MPGVVATAIVGEWATLTLAGEIAYGAVFLATEIAISYGLSALSQALLGKSQNPTNNANASPTSRTVNVRGTIEFMQMVYGEAQVAGYIAFIGLHEPYSLVVVVAVAGHQCEDIGECWLDDRNIPAGDISGGLLTGLSAAKFTGPLGFCRLQITKYLGTHNQSVDFNVNNDFAEWTSQHRGAGIAYVVYILDYEAEVWPNGPPQNYLQLVKGRRLYDPRLDSTNGGSGSHRVTDATTWTWSNNPALACRDYITGGSYWYSLAAPQNILGVGEPNSRINDAYTIAAANICEQAVSIPLGLALTPALTVTGTGLSRTVYKDALGAAGWGTDRAYFSQGMQSIDLTINLNSTTENKMVGLDAHPQDSLTYETIDFAWTYSTADAALAIYENGTKVGNYGSYSIGVTILKITYDGAHVNYYKDGTLERTVAMTGDLFITSAINEAGSIFIITLAAASQKRYTCDTQLSCGDTHMTNMTALLSAMNGHASYTNGKYRLYAGAYDSPSVTLGADDALGDLELITHPNGEDLYNYVTGTFYDEDRNWQLSTIPSQTQYSYQTDDGALYQRSIDLRATRQSYRAQRIALMILAQSRNKISISLSSLSQNAMNIGEWETFYLTLPEYGYNAQVFRCLEWKFLQSGFISITARIENASSYTDPAISDYTDPASNQPPYSQVTPPQTPTGLTLTGFPTYINAVGVLSQNLRAGEIVELWQHTSSSPFSSATKIDEGSKTVFQIAKRDTITRYYWIRCRFNGQYSDTNPTGSGLAAAADLTQTTDIEDGAATDVVIASVSSFTITHRSHSPDGFGFNDVIASISYTPSVDVTALLSVSCNVSLTTGTFIPEYFFGRIMDSSTWAPDNGSESDTGSMAASNNLNVTFSYSIPFSITGGVAKTFQFLGKQFNTGTVVVNNVVFKLEAIKK